MDFKLIQYHVTISDGIGPKTEISKPATIQINHPSNDEYAHRIECEIMYNDIYFEL